MQFCCIEMSQYFPKSSETFGRDINAKVDLSNYANKTNFKNATGIDTSKLAAKFDLVSLKVEVDKVDIDKLKNLPTKLSNLKSKVHIGKLETTAVDLSKLSNVVKNDVVEKTKYNAKIKNIEDKIPDITNLATKTTPNANTNKVKTEIPSINNLDTTTAITSVKNKIPNVSNLVKKN